MDTNPLCVFDFDSIRILDKCDKDVKSRFIESNCLEFEKHSLNTQKCAIHTSQYHVIFGNFSGSCNFDLLGTIVCLIDKKMNKIKPDQSIVVEI